MGTTAIESFTSDHEPVSFIDAVNQSDQQTQEDNMHSNSDDNTCPTALHQITDTHSISIHFLTASIHEHIYMCYMLFLSSTITFDINRPRFNDSSLQHCTVKTNVCISYQKGVISRLTPSIPKIGMHSIPPHIRYELHTHWKYALHTPYCMPSILDSYLNYI